MYKIICFSPFFAFISITVIWPMLLSAARYIYGWIDDFESGEYLPMKGEHLVESMLAKVDVSSLTFKAVALINIPAVTIACVALAVYFFHPNDASEVGQAIFAVSVVVLLSVLVIEGITVATGCVEYHLLRFYKVFNCSLALFAAGFFLTLLSPITTFCITASACVFGAAVLLARSARRLSKLASNFEATGNESSSKNSDVMSK